jgi:hypothetical protein
MFITSLLEIAKFLAEACTFARDIWCARQSLGEEDGTIPETFR